MVEFFSNLQVRLPENLKTDELKRRDEKKVRTIVLAR